jgi:hypothetical protein
MNMGREIREKLLEYDEDSYLLAVESGGTSATNAVDACSNLGGINYGSESYGVVGGIVTARNGKIFSKFLNLPTIFPATVDTTSLVVNPGKTLTIYITNFNMNTTYALSCSAGSASIVGNQILYTAPNEEIDATLSINGRAIPISVKKPTTDTAIITYPSDGSTDLPTTFTVTTDDFSVIGGSDTLQATDWQVSTDSDFSTLIVNNVADTTNLTSYEVSGLSNNTTYYLRARFKGTTLGYGAWSTPVGITTKAASGVMSEMAILIESDIETGAAETTTVGISPDGVYAFVAASYKDTGGAVYVYKYANSTWTEVQKLIPNSTSSEYFGTSIAVSGNSTYLAVGAPKGSRDGLCYIYSLSNGVWTYQASIDYPNTLNSALFGTSVALNYDGSILAGGAIGVSDYEGAVCVCRRTGTTWATGDILVADVRNADDKFGTSVSMSGDGLTILVGADQVGSSTANERGTIYFFTYNGSAWSLLQKQSSASLVNYSAGETGDFGLRDSTVLSRDGYYAIAANAGFGIVYIYYRQSTTPGTQFTIVATIDAASLGLTSLVPSSISISNDATRMVIGDFEIDSNGIAYLLEKDSNNHYSILGNIVPQSFPSYGMYGMRTALSGNGKTAVVAAPQGTYDQVPTYVFK